jgi:hypothetical protein
VLYEAGGDYQSLRRSVDYYAEGTLIWLEADVMIRDLSKGAKSLDDFCNLFHGGTSGPPALKPYNFDDVVAALNTVQPFDWAGFLNQRIHSTEARAPLGGIERSGWKLTYNGVRSDFWKAREETRKIIDLTYSIGMLIASEDGTVADVRFGGPAQKAGIAPSVKLIAVNTRQYTPTVLREADRQDHHRPQTSELLVKNGEFYQTFRIDYHDGERYPAPDAGYLGARFDGNHHCAESEEVKPASAALGFRAHSGWTAAVAVGGSPARPVVLDRRRIETCDAAIHGSRPALSCCRTAEFRKGGSIDPPVPRKFHAAGYACGNRDGRSTHTERSRRGWRRHSIRFRAPVAAAGGNPPLARADPYGGRRVLSRSAGPGERAWLAAGDENKGARDLGAGGNGPPAPPGGLTATDRWTRKIARTTLATGRETRIDGGVDRSRRGRVVTLREQMPRQLVECVPNFSEGRDAGKIDAIVQAILAVPEVVLLDREADADHNRCVLTFAGPPAAVADAAFRSVEKAVALIDLTKQQGAHPRIGAADVVPFIPIEGVTLEECVKLAERLGAEIWSKLQVPVYLYESAAATP